MKADELWSDDLLGKRKECALLLEKLILSKFSDSEDSREEALCFTVDGEWGAGKSFFVKRFSKQLQNSGHSVIEFDAWVNDLSDDPLIGFMSQFRKEIRKLEKGSTPARRASNSFNRVMTSAGKALAPTLIAAAKHVALQKMGAEAVEAFSKASSETEETDGREAAVEAGKTLEGILNGYEDTVSAVGRLKDDINKLLVDLQERKKITLPLFVIIDELDRCRPTYAIRLLEGVKHLFGAPNICFIFSTNTNQLGESVKAVYGSGFDGYQYLRRFFSFHFRLPNASEVKLSLALLPEKSPLVAESVISGLPTDQNLSKRASVAKALQLVSAGFRLKPRTIKQIVFVSESAALGLNKSEKIHALYLFSVAAFASSDPGILERVTTKLSSQEDFTQTLAEIGFEDQLIENPSGSPTSLRAVIYTYLSLSFKSLQKIEEEIHSNLPGDGRVRYPRTLGQFLTHELPSSRTLGVIYPPSISKYPALVSTAGCFREDSDPTN